MSSTTHHNENLPLLQHQSNHKIKQKRCDIYDYDDSRSSCRDNDDNNYYQYSKTRTTKEELCNRETTKWRHGRFLSSNKRRLLFPLVLFLCIVVMIGVLFRSSWDRHYISLWTSVITEDKDKKEVTTNGSSMIIYAEKSIDTNYSRIKNDSSSVLAAGGGSPRNSPRQSQQQQTDSNTAAVLSTKPKDEHGTLPKSKQETDTKSKKEDNEAVMDTQSLPLSSNEAALTSDIVGGFIQQPDARNGTLVFVSEGDLYLTSTTSAINYNTASDPTTTATKLTTTIGNVLTPKINPSGSMVAFTATYNGCRELYIMDISPLSPSSQSKRVTYTDSTYGINYVRGWLSNTSLVIEMTSVEASLPDHRLYKVTILVTPSTTSSTPLTHYTRLSSVLHHTIEPIPFTQAREYARTNTIPTMTMGTKRDYIYSKKEKDDKDYCEYFVRYKQTSSTARYVGGTVEQIYSHYHVTSSPTASLSKTHKLDPDFRGTSKNPQIYQNYLYFLSDRKKNEPEKPKKLDGYNDNAKDQVSLMNLWIRPLFAGVEDSAGNDDVCSLVGKPIQITNVACQFNSIAISEFALDTINGDVYLRIGADLYRLTQLDIQQMMNPPPPSFPQPKHVPIHVYSDLHELHERRLKATLSKSESFDVSINSLTGQLQCYALIRGQAHLLPTDTSVGDILPARQRMIAPSPKSGGISRILAFLPIPPPSNKHNDHTEQDNGTRALILATDPSSPTGELAFYIHSMNPSSLPLFNDNDNVSNYPRPIVGGSLNGGSTRDGGLGSIDATSIAMSSDGRRVAWLDTDQRISIMDISNGNDETDQHSIIFLDKANQLGQPLVDVAGMTFSNNAAGSRYLAVQHSARNQFSIISIADLGAGAGAFNEARSEKQKGARTIIHKDNIYQVSSDRFNSFSPLFGEAPTNTATAATKESTKRKKKKQVLYYLSDKDIISSVKNPWGTRAPSPQYSDNGRVGVYALPLWDTDFTTHGHNTESILDSMSDGGAPAAELGGIGELKMITRDYSNSNNNNMDDVIDDKSTNRSKINKNDDANNDNDNDTNVEELFVFDFGTGELHDLAQRAYRLRNIPISSYNSIVCQLNDSPNHLVLLDMNHGIAYNSNANNAEEEGESRTRGRNTNNNQSGEQRHLSQHQKQWRTRKFRRKNQLRQFHKMGVEWRKQGGAGVDGENGNDDLKGSKASESFPSLRLFDTTGTLESKTSVSMVDISKNLRYIKLSTNQEYLIIITQTSDDVQIIRTTLAAIAPGYGEKIHKASLSKTALIIQPTLEYHQMYNDAWRMLRDYFYDPNMHGVNWPAVHDRYQYLVKRCAKREELDDVLRHVISELSALHCFVHGGEYDLPRVSASPSLKKLNDVASLGISGKSKSEGSGGYIITDVHNRDPDFGLVHNVQLDSPVSHKTMRLSGQIGLEIGDEIINVNGEHVGTTPGGLGYLLCGTAGQSVRLDVIRNSDKSNLNNSEATKEQLSSIMVVPISKSAANNLRYSSWEYKTRVKAQTLARKSNFTIGYIHLRDMESGGMDAFAKGYYPDYNKDAMIVDVRHNVGGNIDSWLLNILQKRSWLYFQDRATNFTNGGLVWDEQFAFRGHLVVLIDEDTASDAETFSRGISELKLGRLVGTRTWGGGIWLNSDNKLVDGGIASAPELGTYNEKWGWGMGIENEGVVPDIWVDNDPRAAFDGSKDFQLEKAIEVLADWMEEEPVVLPNPPGNYPDKSLSSNKNCIPNEK